MKKIITLCLLSSLLLSSCFNWDGNNGSEEKQKKDFYIQTQLWGDFLANPTILKTWRVSARSELTLVSNASGRVENILVKSGDQVQRGQALISLWDTIASYGNNLERSSLALETAKNNYNSNKISLDKQVSDAKISLDNAKRSLATYESDTEKNIELVTDTAENADLSDADSSARLQIEQLTNNIEKAKLDFDIRKISDEQQVGSIINSSRDQLNALSLLFIDVLQFSDELLGVSEANRDLNDDYQDFLWAQDKNQKNLSEKKLKELLDIKSSWVFYDIEQKIDDEMSEAEILEVLDFIQEMYISTKSMLSMLEETINNSLRSEGSLWDTEIDTFLATLNGYQSSLQGNLTGFTSFLTQTESFLATYKQSQQSLLKSIELQEKDREIQIKNLQSSNTSAQIGLDRTELNSNDTLENLKNSVNIAQTNYDVAVENRASNLRNLQNSIDDATLGYNTALREYKKLTINAPSTGEIRTIFAQQWQEVAPGTALIEMVWNAGIRIELTLSAAEKALMSLWDTAKVSIGDTSYDAYVHALSDVADKNFNYYTEIYFESSENIPLWVLAKVELISQKKKILFPLSSVETLGDNKGEVNIYNSELGALEQLRLELWSIYDENIEILSCDELCQSARIITNDISKYDENIFSIVEQIYE